MADASPDAFEKVVDRLLASPHYGERWGRHWLDVARYADTKGYVFFEEPDYPCAYTYRDYVIRAFNDDLPYDRFVLEQLAADRLPLGRRQAAADGAGLPDARRPVHEQRARHHRRPHRRRDAAACSGLTVTCARCHDHKFDPIPTQGLLLALRRLRQLRRADRAAAVRRAAADRRSTPKFAKELQAREQKLTEFVQAKHDELVDGAEDARRRVPAGRPRPARPAEHRGLHALADGNDLNPTMIDPLAGLPGADPQDAPIPSSPPGTPSPPCRRRSSPRRRRDALRASPTRRRRSTRWSPRRFADKPPQSLAEAAQRYGELLNDVDKLWQERCEQTAERTPAPAWPTRPRKSCGRSSTAPTRRRTCRCASYGDLALLPDRPSQAQAAGAAQGRREWRATGPGAPPRAMVLDDLPTPYEPRVFLRGNPNNLGEAVPRQFLERAGRPAAQAVHATAAAGWSWPGPSSTRQPADGPRAGQPRLAAPLRRRPGRARPATSACAASRRRHPELLDYLAATFMDDGWSIKKLHRLDHAVGRLPAGERRPARVPPSRPGERAAVADEPPPARLRGDCATPCWPCPAGSTAPSAGRRCRTSLGPTAQPAHALRLHRPPEPAGPVPHVRLPQPRRHQPAARRDDRAAAGAVPDEPSVRAGLCPATAAAARRDGGNQPGKARRVPVPSRLWTRCRRKTSRPRRAVSGGPATPP